MIEVVARFVDKSLRRSPETVKAKEQDNGEWASKRRDLPGCLAIRSYY